MQTQTLFSQYYVLHCQSLAIWPVNTTLHSVFPVLHLNGITQTRYDHKKNDN